MTTPPDSPSRPAKRLRATSAHTRTGAECPYMHTINRAALDFDQQPVCSVSLSAHNVYACLVCGAFFQGRGPSTPAYAHALDAQHHLFLHLRTAAAHCLPDGYAVRDPGLDEIAAVLSPHFPPEELRALDATPRRVRLLDGSHRLRGAVPLSTPRAADYAAAVLQLLLRVRPLRNLLLRPPRAPSDAAPADAHLELQHALAALARNLWASHAFRAHVSPHTLMQRVSRASGGRFGMLEQSDPVDFMAWLLNFLEKLKGGRGRKGADRESRLGDLVLESFQGEMEIETTPKDGDARKIRSVFWYLPLDLPPKPLFKDPSDRTLVTQLPLSNLLLKFDGKSRHHVVKTEEQRTYTITRLPPYLLLVIRRFAKTKFGIEKNPCVVHLPSEYLSVQEICVADKDARYCLIGAVVHDGTPETGHYHVAIRHDAAQGWFDLDDVTVKPTMAQLIGLSDTYILLYARQ